MCAFAKFWMSVLTDLRNRGIKDVFFVVCDGLKGLPEVVGNAWPQAIVQTCVVHLIRNTFHLASKRDWDALKRDIKPIYTAVNAGAARAALDELADKWGQRYPAIIRLWQNAWEQFIPFLDYDVEIRTVLCSTNAIESLNARYRRAVKARGHFPTEQAALKCLYLVTRSLDPTGTGRRDLLTQMPETPLVRLCRTSGGDVPLAEQDAVAEQGESGASVHLPFDHLGPGVDSLGAAVVEGRRERCCRGLDVQVETAGEGVDVGQAGGPGSGDPLLQAGAVARVGGEHAGEVADQGCQGGHLGAGGFDPGQRLLLAAR